MNDRLPTDWDEMVAWYVVTFGGKTAIPLQVMHALRCMVTEALREGEEKGRREERELAFAVLNDMKADADARGSADEAIVINECMGAVRGDRIDSNANGSDSDKEEGTDGEAATEGVPVVRRDGDDRKNDRAAVPRAPQLEEVPWGEEPPRPSEAPIVDATKALKYVEDALARLEGCFGVPADNDPSIDAQVTRDLWIAQSYLGGHVDLARLRARTAGASERGSAEAKCSECGGSGVVEEDGTGALGYVVKRDCPRGCRSNEAKCTVCGQTPCFCLGASGIHAQEARSDKATPWSLREVVEQAVVLYGLEEDRAKESGDLQGEQFWGSHKATAVGALAFTGVDREAAGAPGCSALADRVATSAPFGETPCTHDEANLVPVQYEHITSGGHSTVAMWCSACGALSRNKDKRPPKWDPVWRLPEVRRESDSTCSRSHVDDELREEWERQYEAEIAKLRAVAEAARKVVDAEMAYRRACYPGLSGSRRADLESARSYRINLLDIVLTAHSSSEGQGGGESP